MTDKGATLRELIAKLNNVQYKSPLIIAYMMDITPNRFFLIILDWIYDFSTLLNLLIMMLAVTLLLHFLPDNGIEFWSREHMNDYWTLVSLTRLSLSCFLVHCGVVPICILTGWSFLSRVYFVFHLISGIFLGYQLYIFIRSGLCSLCLVVAKGLVSNSVYADIMIEAKWCRQHLRLDNVSKGKVYRQQVVNQGQAFCRSFDQAEPYQYLKNVLNIDERISDVGERSKLIVVQNFMLRIVQEYESPSLCMPIMQPIFTCIKSGLISERIPRLFHWHMMLFDDRQSMFALFKDIEKQLDFKVNG